MNGRGPDRRHLLADAATRELAAFIDAVDAAIHRRNQYLRVNTELYQEARWSLEPHELGREAQTLLAMGRGEPLWDRLPPEPRPPIGALEP